MIRTWTLARLKATRMLWLARKRRAEAAAKRLAKAGAAAAKIEKWRERAALCAKMVAAFDAEIERRKPAKVDEWLRGNVVPVSKAPLHVRPTYRRMLLAAADAARELGIVMDVSSSLRTIEQEWANWHAYKAGTGPIAAYPGTSLHGKGRALDLPDNEGEPGVRDNERIRRAFERRSFRFDVASEGWHASYYG